MLLTSCCLQMVRALSFAEGTLSLEYCLTCYTLGVFFLTCFGVVLMSSLITRKICFDCNVGCEGSVYIGSV